MAEMPELIPMGLLMLGPVLLGYGTEKQKAELLPRLLAAEDVWCQGYSEPGAGYDLAALKPHPVSDGDDYIVKYHINRFKKLTSAK
jgi:alkylation response protein AidB-like acyl-CoA dehydrogenase